MKPEQFHKAKQIYSSAAELEPDRRSAFLEEACAGDRELRKKVESLLACDSGAKRFFKTPGTRMPALESRVDADGQVGEGDAAGEASSRRAPLWVFCVLAACTVYLLTVWYMLAVGPETPGLRHRSMVVMFVQPGLAADRAGLREGDLILSINGKSGLERRSELSREYVGRTFRIAVEREGEIRTLDLTLGRKGKAYWTDPEGMGFLADIPAAAICVTLAWMIALRCPGIAAARLGAILLAMWPVWVNFFFRSFVPGLGHFLKSIPAPLAFVPLAAIFATAGALNPVALMFFAGFPRKLLRGGSLWIAIWLPAVASGLVLASGRLASMLGSASIFPIWIRPVGWGVMLVYFFLTPLALIRNYRGLHDVNERRRFRVMVLGVVFALSASTFEVLLDMGYYISGRIESIAEAYWISPFYMVGTLVSAAGPMSIAYSILHHRVFDIRVMIRRGLRYAAARRILLALAPLFLLILAADLVLHEDRTLAEVFLSRGWLYGALGAASLAAHLKRDSWLEALDRRFFRERYDARRILQSVLRQIREASGLEEAAPQVVSEIDAALHPEFAALLLRRPGQNRFAILSSSGRFRLQPEVASGSKLMGLVRLLNKPVEIPLADKGWFKRRLPPEETLWLDETQIEWIFPVTLGDGRKELLLALGPKRSEEPYTQEDQELIEGVTSGLSLLVDRPAPPPDEKMPHEASLSGAPLLPRRYLIRRELGRGGMGAVYEAHDLELDREVAVKVMLRDLLSSSEAIARFRREARAAAGFSHPNVVTVYDFGFAPGGEAYFVMELLTGSTLRRLLRTEARLPLGRAAALLRGICSALEAAHKRRLLHRDLKPENIFLANQEGAEVPKILDFGVAKRVEAADAKISDWTLPGQLLGTISYMSPEQLRGEQPAPAWDLWALAVISYEMVTGAHPFDRSGESLISALLTGKLTPARIHLGNGSEGWNEFFADALASDHVRRPSTAREFLSRFEATMFRR